MKHSLRNQIAATFIALIMISVAAIAVVNAVFLEEYYVSKKADALESTYIQLESFDGRSDTVSTSFQKFCAEKNLSWVVVNVQGQILGWFGQEKEGDRLAAKLFGYQTGLEQSNPVEIKATQDYVVQKNQDTFAGMDYVELWGRLESGNYCIVRSPLESIRESADISNMFYIYAGLIISLVSAGIVWLLTNHLTKPISMLTELSKKMAGLDFNEKYKSRKIRNEVDTLGENFNTMSEQLERTISQLKSANNELQKDIESKIQLEQRRKEFLDNVSHELKTPIALIQGYAEGLKDNITEDPESMAFYCDVIIDESVKMNTLVKQLLTLNQLESGNDSVTMERFDIVELIRGILQASTILIEQKEAKVNFSQDSSCICVWADEFKIEEVITNYLTNALNHLDKERVIEIKVQDKGELVRVSVFNTGQPIPEEDIENIWNKFYKVDKARTREYGGSGVGLSIVKAIMESHHQQCGVINYENGVEFWFELNQKAL